MCMKNIFKCEKIIAYEKIIADAERRAGQYVLGTEDIKDPYLLHQRKIIEDMIKRMNLEGGKSVKTKDSL